MSKPIAAPVLSTLSERVTEELRLAILSGSILPGAKLRVEDLSQQFGYSATPIRESLNRLIAGGMVQAIGQRGFRVEPASYDDLADLMDTREFVAVKALRQSILRGDSAWVSNIDATLLRLSRFYRKPVARSLEGSYEFDLAHKAFHHALIAACGSPRLLQINSVLNDQAYRYRLLLAKSRPLERREDNTHHEQLARVVVARDIKGACATLREHLRKTLTAIDAADRLVVNARLELVQQPAAVGKRSTRSTRLATADSSRKRLKARQGDAVVL
ncbi:MAG: GntR family transcriptional regulator [Proteobacteria bacterium]|nr:GntR family transcriptional regulator [Pseudomonadota bacterium]